MPSPSRSRLFLLFAVVSSFVAIVSFVAMQLAFGADTLAFEFVGFALFAVFLASLVTTVVGVVGAIVKAGR